MARKVIQNSVPMGYAIGAVAISFLLGMIMEQQTGKVGETGRRGKAAATRGKAKAKAKMAKVQSAVRAKKAGYQAKRKSQKLTGLEKQKADIEAKLTKLRSNRRKRITARRK